MIDTTFFFPKSLKELPIWVLWRLEDRKGKRTKVPYQINGRRASATDPATWTTFDKALQTGRQHTDLYRGVGAVMSTRYRTIFIDIDHCLNPLTGNFDDRAEDILSAFMDDDGNLTTFAEVSQSGTGLHLIVIGDIPRSFKNSQKNVEMYDNGRFIAMTGRAFSACEPSECADGLRYVFERYKTPSKVIDWTSRPAVDPATRHEDDWIIRHASDREGSKFSALFEGDWSGYNSRSEADLALCKILAFWTNNDPEAIDRLFRRSGLYRAKWERNNYSTPTIRTAISTNDDTLIEFTRRRIRERGLASIGELSTVRH
jgi:putative DNA primase/helicase